VDDADTTDICEYLRLQCDGTDGSAISGVYDKMPFYGDLVYLDFYDSFSTGIRAKVNIFTSKE
jgi:hypothetical protein